MKYILLIGILCICLLPARSQNFIGMREDRIREVMASEKPDMTLDTRVKNDTFRYLKYQSGNDDETWLIFIDEKNWCNGVRITCDNRIMDMKVREMNGIYRQKGSDRWEHGSGNNEITISLKRDSSFFSLTWERARQ
jgi:hypothetical protein